MTYSDEIRQRAAAEVLELGEMLYDTAIDAATRQSVQGEEADESLVEEIRSAADEFFVALRLLLGVEKQFIEGDALGCQGFIRDAHDALSCPAPPRGRP